MLAMLGLKLSRAGVVAILIAALLLLAGLAFLGGMAAIDRMERRAADAATQARDAHWTVEIARSNAEAEKRRAAQAQAAATIESETGARIAALSSQLEDMERANAALPNGDACGLSRDRVRLLPK